MKQDGPVWISALIILMSQEMSTCGCSIILSILNMLEISMVKFVLFLIEETFLWTRALREKEREI